MTDKERLELAIKNLYFAIGVISGSDKDGKLSPEVHQLWEALEVIEMEKGKGE